MRLGIPASYGYYAYKPFIETFFKELGIDVVYGTKTDRKIMETGIKGCVDEACLPVKVCYGHTKVLADDCDRIAIPRIMKTEYGEAICPKVAGLPELVGKNIPAEKLIFTKPLYLDDLKKAKKLLWRNCKELGVSKNQFKRAYDKALQEQETARPGLNETEYKYRVLLLGHSYNINDSFVNLKLAGKLHKMEIGIVTNEAVTRKEKEKAIEKMGLMKEPYWESFTNNMGSALVLSQSEAVDGIIYLSSFSCGTDSFTTEILKKNIHNLPILILKIDQQTGEAGYDTRLEAFKEVIAKR